LAVGFVCSRKLLVMPKLHLHIGCEKTGTTSVQRFLRANRELLAQNAILYPHAPGEENQMALAVAAQSEFGPLRKKIFQLRSWPEVEEFRVKLRDGLRSELEARPYDRVFMSGEHCSSRLVTHEEVAWLRDFLHEFFDDMTIVVYIRRQDDFLLSTYSTDVKGGAVHPLRVPDGDLAQRRYNYWELLSRWADVFGRERIICRKYERGSLKGGDIIQDFLDAIGLDADLAYTHPRHLNESLDAECLEFLRLLNRHIPRLTNEGVNKTRGNIVSLLLNLPQGPLLTLPAAELAAFMSRFRESNARVAAEYFGGMKENSDDPLFDRSHDTRPRAAAPEMTLETAIRFFAAIWEQKQTQIETKQKHIETLMARVARLRGERPRGGKPLGARRAEKHQAIRS
jgi:hypothetical protein